MKTSNRKPLFLAIAGLSALGVVGAANAVSVSQTGLGQVLVYPYYTVKGAAASPFNTLLSIVNTTGSTKAVKVRFREGKASVEVLDFNLFLSPYDVWVAEIQPSATGGAKIFAGDNSCTIPTIPATGVEFRNSLYKGDLVGDGTLERLREGYMEVFEMSTYADSDLVAIGAKHGASGRPYDCSLVTDLTAQGGYPAQGGLTGTASLVQPGSGLNVATDPVPLANFKMDVEFYATTGQEEPNFAQAERFATTPVNNNNVWVSNWTQGYDAVSAALMRSAVINEFVLDAGTASATNWVVTFPSKHHYVGASAVRPFTAKLGKSGACEPITLDLWNREELTDVPPPGDFSPTQGQDSVQICWEANVVLFSAQNVLKSSNTLAVPPFAEHGWAQLGFVAAGHVLPTAAAAYVNLNQSVAQTTVGGTQSHTFIGLPVIGFAVQTFSPSVTSSYAGTFAHRWVQEPIGFNVK